MSGLEVVRLLDVWIEGQPRPVGILEGLAGSTYPLRFTYAAGYSGPALSAAMPVRGHPYENREARVFFDNLLPEGPQRDVVQRRPGERPIAPEDVAGLLEVLGSECPGAVSVVPAGQTPIKMSGDLDADYDPISRTEVGRLLAEASRGRYDHSVVRFSLAGVQRKIALAIDPETSEFLVPKQAGIPTTHLLKVEAAGDNRTRGIVRNELLCLRLAAALDLPAANAVSDEIGGILALVVQRYDRVIEDRTVSRLHQEDAAQALGLDRTEKYEDDAAKRGRDASLKALVQRFARLTAKPADARDLFRRAAWFNWLIANDDAHAKNFSILYGKEIRDPVVAPLYDLVCIEALPANVDTMAMAINGVFRAADVDGTGIRWLAGLDVRPKLASSALRLRLDGFRDIAGRILPAIDDMVADGDFTRQEVKPIRDVIASRIRITNAEMGWEIPVEGDAPIQGGGGWAMPVS